ncbi:MAG: glycosyltransferase [Treponema sp.]|nr:glycosyltransferase [Treponema sp.]
MKIWVVSMECAGVIEAGGVKDVTFSLCRAFSACGNEVTLFLPVFAVTSFEHLVNVQEKIFSAEVHICNHNHTVFYSTANLALCKKVTVVLVHHKAFEEKHAVYVYTREDTFENQCFIPGTGHRDVHFLDALLSKASAEYMTLLFEEKRPDVVHCHDASTAITPCYMAQKQTLFSGTKYFVTIHNAGPAYHHDFSSVDEAAYYTELPLAFLNDAKNGCRVEPFLLAAKDATLTAVSTFYADEIMNPENAVFTDGLSAEFAKKSIKIRGITNGIDADIYSPEDSTISLLPYEFSPKKSDFSGKYKNRAFFLDLCGAVLGGTTEVCSVNDKKSDFYSKYLSGIEKCGFLYSDDENTCVYFVYHGRIVTQKGIPLLVRVMEKLLSDSAYANFRLIVMGQGERELEETLQDFVARFEGKAVYLKGYNRALSRLCVAAADFSLLPSNFEPCCLEDFISQIYGTLPIAHATGGLRKIIDAKTGFLYEENTEEALNAAILRAVELKKNPAELHALAKNTALYITRTYSWNAIVREKYIPLFEENGK